MSNQKPQTKSHKLQINNAQLDHLIDSLQNQLQQPHTETKYDTTDIFYVPPKSTLEMLVDIRDGKEYNDQMLHGLCL